MDFNIPGQTLATAKVVLPTSQVMPLPIAAGPPPVVAPPAPHDESATYAPDTNVPIWVTARRAPGAQAAAAPPVSENSANEPSPVHDAPGQDAAAVFNKANASLETPGPSVLATV